MAKHLDLEEQEQLAELKHYWRLYGNIVTWALIVVFGSIAGWNIYQYWQRSQAGQSAAMYDQVEQAAASGDTARLERALADMKDKFGSTVYAQQAGLLAARVFHEKGKTDAAKSALGWVADKAGDEGYKAIARLRLSGLLMEAKAYDEALAQLSAALPREFDALAADRRGDIYNLQGKKAEARAEYGRAWAAFDERSEYRRMVEVKLNAMGADPKADGAAKPGAATEVKK
ncbi:MAG: tetratricopeptide repeat protein [Burkholderiaceae bacterium]|nr:tetratricopeptide repeat protein [Burkholderiaceae bacterium]MDO9090239.1 tetratricopeptide repeat protein [Burkholderiaceae bacterium]MDP1968657.1 tetratricopeptide repeat protein [Burkholderiaceae bacterium]